MSFFVLHNIQDLLYTTDAMTPVDTQLVELCCSGDRAALYSLLDTHTPSSYVTNKMLAAATGSENIELVRYLLSRYPDLSLSGSPILAATDVASISLFQAFFEKDPAVVHMRFEREGTPLALAVMGGRPLEFVSFLLSCGADPNQPTSIIPLPVAGASCSYGGSIDAVALLLKHGADLQHTGALCMAASGGYVEVVRFLLEHGASPATDQRIDGIPDITNMGPAIYVAAHEGHVEIADMLLKNGADKNQRNQDGQTALSIAEKKGHDQILRLFKDRMSERDVNST